MLLKLQFMLLEIGRIEIFVPWTCGSMSFRQFLMQKRHEN